MVNSQVPKVQKAKDGSTELTVQLVGFMTGKPVEIYGYVKQDSGPSARFRVYREVPKTDEQDSADVLVTVPAGKLDLQPNEPVTVITWVSEIWPSVLTVDKPAPEEYQAAWKIDDTASKEAWWSAASQAWSSEAEGLGGERGGAGQPW
jgi:hypothetical protein